MSDDAGTTPIERVAEWRKRYEVKPGESLWQAMFGEPCPQFGGGVSVRVARYAAAADERLEAKS